MQQTLKQYVLDHPGRTPAEIAQALGLKRGSVKKALLRLRERYIMISQEGHYYPVHSSLAYFDMTPLELPEVTPRPLNWYLACALAAVPAGLVAYTIGYGGLGWLHFLR